MAKNNSKSNVIQFPAKEKTPLDEVVAKFASGEYVAMFIAASTYDGRVEQIEVGKQ